ncbi:MAG: hypothetical protein JSW71_17045 [Gemmatimonadota bacterium]|nr:MAG: hypothetical protein JSW71_17045 [Gemmatimonadota bacterium]
MERDYILRLIEQAGTMLKHLLRQVRGGSVDRAAFDRDLQRATQLCGLDLDLLRICDAEGLLQMVAFTGAPDPSRTWLAAETLYLDSIAAAAAGDADAARQGYEKAAFLFRLMEPSWALPTGFPEASTRLAEIAERVALLEVADGQCG